MDIDIDLCPSKVGLIISKIAAERSKMFNDDVPDWAKKLFGCTRISTFGTEGTKSAILTACRGYRTNEYPNGIDVDQAQYMASLIPSERGFLWPIKDVVYGNDEKNRKPITTFIREMNNYPGLLDIVIAIEGLINKRSSHASGVVFFDGDPFEHSAFMKTPKGEIITQWNLHDAEYMGLTKYDFLVTEVQDKIVQTIQFLQEDGKIEKDLSLREIYNKYLHPNVLPIDDEKIWEALGNGELKPSAEWVSWSELSDAKKEGTPEPLKYSKYGIPHIWCGAYYLKNEYRPTTGSSVGITPMVGDGSINNPAGLNTPVLTKWLSKEEGNIKQYDIRVELVEFGVSQDALNYFQSKDTQNRGYDVTATLQYFYAVFSITNLSDDTLTITDDSALCDKNANASNRTGNIYGMTDTVTLQPGEEGYIETWGRSMELPKKYLIWGKSFERLLDPVWFRVLAGNIDDTSENKGVYVSNQK